MDGVEKKCVSPIARRFSTWPIQWVLCLVAISTHSLKKKEKMASDISILFERLYSYTHLHTHTHTAHYVHCTTTTVSTKPKAASLFYYTQNNILARVQLSVIPIRGTCQSTFTTFFLYLCSLPPSAPPFFSSKQQKKLFFEKRNGSLRVTMCVWVPASRARISKGRPLSWFFRS